MLFITNRSINEPPKAKIKKTRNISFDLDDSQAGHSVYFCVRSGKEDYQEIGSKAFLDELRECKPEQLLFYIHGFSNLPEDDIFPRAETLQKMFGKSFVKVIPLIWPCDNDLGVIKDYWDDQKAADASSFAFARVLEKFMSWRDQNPEDPPCMKRINVLAHSMGNRVLRETLSNWAKYDRNWKVPLIFRNTFMVAADIINESLEREESGKFICQASRNVSVYYASDDIALRASKVSNLKNKVASRRLGHSGPENLELVPRNVYSIDCDDVNTKYDRLKGHSYFLESKKGKKITPGKVFNHIFNSIKTGRVDVADPIKRTHIIKG
ncbi:MAG: alpha/beta hydrolase [Nitrospina sp.]|mgnify:CR=1 FL=1|jgi:esterase/lipase superfamily enzyme|nr:alpha/beta hydrolase [Nitrospina sp.]MBT6717271.1 alpha/beta hydrolase [Nitrospina sp.]